MRSTLLQKNEVFILIFSKQKFKIIYQRVAPDKKINNNFLSFKIKSLRILGKTMFIHTDSREQPIFPKGSSRGSWRRVLRTIANIYFLKLLELTNASRATAFGREFQALQVAF